MAGPYQALRLRRGEDYSILRTDGPVFVFSGQGAEWAGMGRALLHAEPAFAATVEQLEPIVAAECGFSVRDPSDLPDSCARTESGGELFVTDIGTFAELNAVWEAWVSPGNTPCRTTIETKLASPKYAIEISAIAAV